MKFLGLSLLIAVLALPAEAQFITHLPIAPPKPVVSPKTKRDQACEQLKRDWLSTTAEAKAHELMETLRRGNPKSDKQKTAKSHFKHDEDPKRVVEFSSDVDQNHVQMNKIIESKVDCIGDEVNAPSARLTFVFKITTKDHKVHEFPETLIVNHKGLQIVRLDEKQQKIGSYDTCNSVLPKQTQEVLSFAHLIHNTDGIDSTYLEVDPVVNPKTSPIYIKLLQDFDALNASIDRTEKQ